MLDKHIKEIEQQQKQIMAIKPLSKEQLQELRSYYKIGITYTSNALEGNTLSESETKVVIEEGITIAGKPLKHHLEAVGHAAAYDYIFSLIKKNSLSENEIKKLHKLFYQKIDTTNAGKYRKKQVYITGSQFVPPKAEQLPNLMKDLIHWYNTEHQHPVIKAALLHQKFVVIHPFIDGNGRVARLLMNLHLLKNNFPVTIIPPILRADYIALLEKSHTDTQPFIEFIAGCVKQAQLEYLRLLT
ncbi:MAG: Fic family protein [Bacteroidales bacterium]|jgi:Fic family protein|nr:Fic family protein [Bacteroidales bacterium]